jgi:hypothetical protein
MDAGFIESYRRVVESLPKQQKRAVEELGNLLQTWSLLQITHVASEVRQRLTTLELFRERILDERTYEIAGEDSIHRILERAMWLVDEHYWLLAGNRTLRRQIGDAMSTEDRKRWGKRRPDFVCCTTPEGRLLIIEIKRPSHVLSVEDLQQVEDYLVLAKKYFKYRSYEAMLVGSSHASAVEDRLAFRTGITARTYGELVDDTEKRYREYLKAFDKPVRTTDS